jgi:hypothetical protein
MHRVNRNNPTNDNATVNVREAFAIPEGYKVPHVALEPHERTDRAPTMAFTGVLQVFPRRRLLSS